MRQVVLDTETSGLSPSQGHRIIEIGCVELMHRRVSGKTFHAYLQPDRAIDAGAIRVHGITNEFLEGKPRFADICEEFKHFIKGAELIIHNAPFDLGFIENEFRLSKDRAWEKLEQYCQIIDTLSLARKKHPGQRNNLDALCKRYNINNQHREKHGALLDAEILADVFLSMTGGQDKLNWEEAQLVEQTEVILQRPAVNIRVGEVIKANEEELAAHHALLEKMEKKGTPCIWLKEVDLV